MLCTYCGAQNPDDAIFCIECGKNLKGSEVKEASQMETAEKIEERKKVESIEGQNVKKCPYCSEEVKIDALKCKHCGEWLERSSKSRNNDGTPQYSNAQPIGRLLPLLALSFGTYLLYWYYKNWKHLKNHKNLDISPGGRTILLFIPIVNIFMLYEQFRDIKNYAKESGCKTYSPGFMTLAYIVIPFFFTWIPPASALGIWPLMVVQETLNDYWKAEQPDLPVKKSFTDGELLVIILGGIITFAVIVSYLIYNAGNV